METASSHGKEDEKDHSQAKEPHGLGEGKAQKGIGEELLLQRRVPGISNDEAPKHSPNSSLRASHPYVATPMNLAAVSMSLEMVRVWKLWLGIREIRVVGLPSC